jgi:hypothetical protein
MALAVQNTPPRFQGLGHSQDTIGWRHFLEGMILKKNIGSTATVLRGKQFPDEFGQMVLWTHHTAA